MTSKFRWPAALAAALVLVPPATGQEPGTRIQRYERARIPETTRLSDSEKARVALNAYSTCLIDRNAGAVEDVLAKRLDDAESNRAFKKLAVDDCLYDGELRFTESLMRGSLFAALYRKRFREVSAPLSAAPVDMATGASAASSEKDRAHGFLLEFADCVVRKDTVNSRALILAPTAGTRETAAFEALSAAFGPCMRQGMTLKFTKPVLYGLIGEALYRESAAAEPVQ